MVITKEERNALTEKKSVNAETMFNTVNAHLEMLPELANAFKILDYSIAERHSTALERAIKEKKELWKVEAVVNTGGSEGVYVDCNVLLYPEGKCRLGTYKTLEEDTPAYIQMGMIAGAFTTIAEKYLWVNGL